MPHEPFALCLIRRLRGSGCAALFFAACFCCARSQPLAALPDAAAKTVEVTLDLASPPVPLPQIFQPNIDISGRGFHADPAWPKSVADPHVLDVWFSEIGRAGMLRLRYNLWQVHELAKDPAQQQALLRNYETIIKEISDGGGTVLLSLFGTPAGLGKVLDPKSPPVDMRAYKALVKELIRLLSCEKRYAVWYEVWSAPDLDGFFLGSKLEYLYLYRAVAEAVKELEAQYGLQIPVGGPSTSWWFQTIDGNTALNPERSLMYELIRFCFHYRLPLDFISWHAYATDPKVEQEQSVYKRRSAVYLIRDWLRYFKFDHTTPLIVSEWNFDAGANDASERGGASHISASYLPARLKGMYEAGIDYALFFCLEDFKANPAGVVRNVGAFSYDAQSRDYKGQGKAVYGALRMLSRLGKNWIVSGVRTNDDFVTVIPTRTPDGFAILIAQYIDPDPVRSLLSRMIAGLREGERRILLNLVSTGQFEDLLKGSINPRTVRLTRRLRTVVQEAQELRAAAEQAKEHPRHLRVRLRNAPGRYQYQRFAIDGANQEQAFEPLETRLLEPEKEPELLLPLLPYSLQLLVLRKDIPAAPPAVEPGETP